MLCSWFLSFAAEPPRDHEVWPRGDRYSGGAATGCACRWVVARLPGAVGPHRVGRAVAMAYELRYAVGW